jgi:hypothetical protein
MPEVLPRLAVANGTRSPLRTYWNGLEEARPMLLSTILAGLAVISVAIEMPVTAAVLGAVAFWLIGHGA